LPFNNKNGQPILGQDTMKKQIERIIKPNSSYLIAFSIFLLFILTLHFLTTSFGMHSSNASVTIYIEFWLIISIIGLMLSIIFDIKLGSTTKKYFIVSTILVSFFCFFSTPIRTWLIASSYEKARHICIPLNLYKQKFGVYPNTLSDLENKLEINIPTRANLGTQYIYYTNDGKSYTIRFQSFFGQMAEYDSESDRWVMED